MSTTPVNRFIIGNDCGLILISGKVPGGDFFKFLTVIHGDTKVN